MDRVLIERIALVLAEEGHEVADLWFPDIDRGDPRRGGRRSTPDAALLIDGRQAAIEVTGFWTESRGRAAARAAYISELLEVALEEADLPRTTYAFISYNPLLLAELNDRRDTTRDVNAISRSVIEIARADQPVSRARVAPSVAPGWVHNIQVTTVDWNSRHDVVAMPSRSDVLADIPATIEDIARAKGEQLAEWGLAIVAIFRSWGEGPDDLVAAFATRTDWPFWRAYWLDAADAHLVWERP